MHGPRSWLRALTVRRDGNVTVLFGGALMMLIATAALGIDTATIFLEKRRLQGIADAAALAAASDLAQARPRADAAVRINAPGDARIVTVATGVFTPDVGVPRDQRFVVGADPANAVRIAMQRGVPTFFARVFGADRTTTIGAEATAARIDVAAISIGSRLATVGGGLPGALLSTLAGSEVQLTVMDYNALVGGRVDILRMAELLRIRMGADVATFGQALSGDVSLPVAVEAMAGAASDDATAQALRGIAAHLPARRIRLDDIIALGPLGEDMHADPARPIRVEGFALLREALAIGAASRQVRSDVALGVPGIAATRLWLEIGERPSSTRWLSVDAARRATVRTAQSRLWIDVRLVAAPLGLGAVRVPLFVELAEAEATLTGVSCAGGRSRAMATLAVTPSIGTAAIAELDPATLAAFTRPVDLAPARLVAAPLVTVSGFAQVRLGGVTPQTVTFTAAEIDAQTPRSVATGDLAGGIAASLLRGITLRADVIGIGVSAGVVTATVGGVLAAAAPALDQVIDQVTAIAGVRLGQADVTVDAVRCGTPVLVG